MSSSASRCVKAQDEPGVFLHTGGEGRGGDSQAFCFLSKLLRSHIQHGPRVCSCTAVLLSLMLVQKLVVVYREALVQASGGV